MGTAKEQFGHEASPLNTNYNPFGSGGGTLGTYDVLGNAFDRFNPYVKAGRKQKAARDAYKRGPSGPEGITGDASMPQFTNADGTMKSQFTLDASKYDLGKRYLDQLGNRAMSVGPSSWAKMQNRAIDQETAGLRDQAGVDANNAMGMSMSNLASSGGLDSGARERMSNQVGMSRLNNVQQASRQGSLAKTATGVEDERQKLGLLQALPGMHQNQAMFKAGLDSKNVQNAMNSELFKYGEQMKAFTGNKMADATAASGGKK